jgi:hypothetical protein
MDVVRVSTEPPRVLSITAVSEDKYDVTNSGRYIILSRKQPGGRQARPKISFQTNKKHSHLPISRGKDFKPLREKEVC